MKRSLLTLFTFFCLAKQFLALAAVAEEASEKELGIVLEVLDRFMVAGREGDAARGARLLDMYESSPKKTVRDIEAYFKSERETFSRYVSIDSDVYGFEYREKGYRGPNLVVEGGVETTGGFTAEFSSRLVLREGRWRILNLEID
ncbi:nuclear transport factor 2 family protein [Pelagicoccus mobilis]|uniref:Nuclear transport factor 2 family protein n=1 Tax=Pelagicoccus mobilis TaxID=415221 RepID=A0A934S619_9BACT|nr:nuclear transport factor 2 family protein [Pelagicoccus mobilis]MBK1879603.1 nuclear transport factor 2 family protein [Pelagicoccus mobilis]